MSPCLTDSAIAEFVQGLSTPAEAHAIEAHVARCSVCRQLLSRTSALLLSGAAASSSSITHDATAPSRSAPRRWTRGLALAGLAVAIAAIAGGALLLSRARHAAPAARPSLAIVDVGAGWAGVMVGELLRVSLGSDGAALVVDGDASARAAGELGAAVAPPSTPATASAWRRRLGVAQLIVLSTERDAATGRLAVTLQLWPAGASPIREVGGEDALAALAARLDGRVRAAWQWQARPSSAVLLPSGAALRAYAEGLLAHRAGDEAGALARWTRAAELAPDDALILTARAEALLALGRPHAARAVAARAVATAAALPSLSPSLSPSPWRQRLEARARLAAGDVTGALPLVRALGDADLAGALAEAQRARGDVKGAATTLVLARARPVAADAAVALTVEAARLAVAGGDGERARREAQAATRAATASGATTWLAASRRVESAAALLLGDVAAARRAAAEAVARASERGDAAEQIDALLALGVAQSASGSSGPAADDGAAERSFEQALAQARAHERLDRVARSLGNLAALAARAGHAEAAARWLDQLAETARLAGEPDAEAAARRDRAALPR